MPTKKKTNYVSYELKRLDTYLSQLTSYLDAHPPDKMVDRIEWIQTPRGGEIPKVISSIETQLKVFMSTLQQLPKLLSDINELRKQVEGQAKEIEIRGEQEMPGFMSSDDDQEDNRKTTDNKKENLYLPPADNLREDLEELSDDDFWMNDD